MLSSITDYCKNLIDSVRERMQNPFTEKNKTPFAGAFVISFIIYNWRLVYTILNFDSYETRLSKIEIISYYLDQEVWWMRVGMPIGISLLSITTFYIFNNISLGITTISNRWVKSSVLYLTDRSKTIAREEHDFRLNTMKRKYEKIQLDFNSSETEKNIIDQQLANLNSMYKEKVQENEKLKEKISLQGDSDSGQTKFAIIYSRYGAEGTYTDVTDVISNIFISAEKFSVDNITLEGDPIRHSIKELFVIYRKGQNVINLTANEGEIVQLIDGELVVHETATSVRKQNSLKNQEKLANFLNGAWLLIFTKDGLTQDSEPIIIDSTGRYFAHSKIRFYLRTIEIDESLGRISFNKIGLNRILHSKETLTIHDSNTLIGTDSIGYKVEYKRQEEAMLYNEPIKVKGKTSSNKFAKHPYSESFDSKFLDSKEGIFCIWAYVADAHHKVYESSLEKYIISYATNGGNKINNPSLADFPNAWAIERITPSPNDLSGRWRFWCNGVEKDRTVIDYSGIVSGGWHLFTVSWSQVKNYIKFLIDDDVMGESRFENWPTDFSSSVVIGTWPQMNPKQYFDSMVGPWKFVESGYSAAFIKQTFENRPKNV